MSRIDEKIGAAIDRHQMLHGCDRLIVGFSGGADSTALLHYVTTHFPGTVTAAHVNHNLRGDESDRDEYFVRRFCQERHIPLAVRSVDVLALAKERGQSVESCGRSVRYEFFASLCAGDSDRIATAHTGSDSVETILFHLARGTGIRGMTGIPPVRGNIIRPLIDLTRADVEEYCQEHDLAFVTDSTNLTGDYSRNVIRHQAVPALRQINPAMEQAVTRLARQLSDQEAALTHYAADLLRQAERPGGYDLAVLREVPKAVTIQAVLCLFREDGVGEKLTDQKLAAVYDAVMAGHGGVAITGELAVRAEQGLLLLIRPNRQRSPAMVAFTVPMTAVVGEKQVKTDWFSPLNCKNNENSSSFLFSNVLDYDTIPSNAVFRTRRPGDTFRPAGRGVTKRLKQLFQEAAIPAAFRDDVLLLASGSAVLWAEGFGPAEGCAVTAETKQAVALLREGERYASRCGTGSADP